MKKYGRIFIGIFAMALLLVTAMACGKKEHVHTFPAAETVTEATCLSEGVNKYSCSGCGYVRVEKTPAISHNYVVAEEVEATCVASGYKQKVCTKCGLNDVVFDEKLPHELLREKVESNCISKGYIFEKCADCDYFSITYTDEPTGHDYKEERVLRGTCDKAMIAVLKCAECGETDYVDDKEITPHVYNIENISPTCTKSGEKRSTCIYCQHILSSEIPPLEHSFSIARTSSTCYERGKIVRFCTNDGCGLIEQESELEYRAHVMSYVSSGEEVLLYSRDGINVYSDSECNNRISSSDCKEFKSGMHFVCNNVDNCGMRKSLGTHDNKCNDTATCEKDGVYSETCVKCGFVSVYEVSQAKGHADDGVQFKCKKNQLLTDEYHLNGGYEDKDICYRCTTCKKYVPTIKHTPNVDKQDVACDNPQFCIICQTVMYEVSHTAPQITCVSAKNDEYYYCSSCHEYKMGQLTRHNFILSDEIAATCVDDKINIYKCACGEIDRKKEIGTALGHSVPDGIYACRVDYDLSEEYFAVYNETMDVAYRCKTCAEYIAAVAHNINCNKEEVTCIKNQHCTYCEEVFLTKDHVVPDLTCVSIKGDGFYYCASCLTVSLGELTPHNYIVNDGNMPASCTKNERIIYNCRCGKPNPNGFVEIAGTKLGHNVPTHITMPKSNCQKGHLLHFTEYSCKNKGCKMDFSSLADKNGDIYCLDLNNYLDSNSFASDYLYDANTGIASDRIMLAVLDCCKGSSYRFVTQEHKYSDPVASEDITIDDVFYDYVPSTCTTKGSAAYACTKCSEITYREEVLALRPDNHEGEVLNCKKHCSACIPEDADCNFALVLIVLRSDGTPAKNHGLEVSSTYNMDFLGEEGRIEETVDKAGKKCYKFSEKYAAELSNVAGLGYGYKSAAGAKNKNVKEIFDWNSVYLYKNEVNTITVYIEGVNEEE